MVQRAASVFRASDLIFDVEDRHDRQILNSVEDRGPDVGIVVGEHDKPDAVSDDG